MELEWTQQDGFLEAEVPVKKPKHGFTETASITIEPRPYYCDRGRFIAKCFANPADGFPLDDHEGWPRYYFDLDVAKSEIKKWVEIRLEQA